jgi:putative copper resistance protein D
LRWALYADLAVVFGVPVASVVTGARRAIDRWRGVLAIAALAGIIIGCGGFLLVLAAMAGVSVAQLDHGLVLSLLTSTAVGRAFIIRSVALAACFGLALHRAPAWLALRIVAGGVAVGTLAWSGHAAASQGVAGWLRLGGDILHLAAALSWVGALVLFAGLLWRPLTAPSAQVAQALSTFALAGSVIVALLAASGVANLLFLMPVAQLPGLLHSLYGRLLLLKLVVFLAMLGLAALNRFALTPALDRAHAGASLAEIRRLRLSVSLELLAALAVLGLVGWLGTLDPLGLRT